MPQQLPKKRRWLRRIVVSLVVLVVVAVLFGPMVVGKILSTTLKSMVSSQLNADLILADVQYHPPYGVLVENAQLVGKDDEGRSATLFEIKSIDLKLAELPLGKGPLVIKELLIDDPTIHVIQTNKGVIGQTGLVKESGPSDPNMKLSEMFELRRVAISGGRFVYEDRREKDPSVVEWKGVDVDLKTEPKDRANYDYSFTAKNLPLTQIEAEGSMNIDSLFFDLRKFVLQVKADANAIPSQLPSALQKLWKQYAISGDLTLTAKGQVPLAQLDRCLYDATIDLKNASAYLVDQKMPLDSVNVKIDVTNRPQLAANAPATQPTTQPALQPLSAPITMKIQTLQAASGDLLVNLRRGKITFALDGLSWKVEDIAGRIAFPDERPPAVTKLEGPLNSTHTRGNIPITLTGSGKTTPPVAPATQPTTSYNLNLVANNGELYFTQHKIPMKAIRGEIAVNPTGMKITKLDAKPMNGTLSFARGEMKFDDALSWNFSGNLKNLDLNLLAPALIDDPEARKKFSGDGAVVGTASGAFKAPDSAGRFKAKGEASIVNGNFWQVGVLQKVAEGTKTPRNALTFGEIAAVFEIKDRKVFLEDAAVSSPALGIQGAGDIGFDGNLELTLIASPLGDWRKNLQRTEVPILSDVGAAIVGGIQDVGKGLTKALLYEVRVSGPAKDAQVQTVVAPAITGGLVEDMALNRIEKLRLLEALKKLPPKKKPQPLRKPSTTPTP